MAKDFKKLAQDVMDSAKLLSDGAPELMQGYVGMSRDAYGENVLSRKMKELISLSISVALRCDSCVAYHAKRVAQLGATREEVLDAMGVAVQMGGGPAVVYGGEALKAFDSFASD